MATIDEQYLQLQRELLNPTGKRMVGKVEEVRKKRTWKLIGELPPEEQVKLRQRWRENAKRYRLKKKQERAQLIMARIKQEPGVQGEQGVQGVPTPGVHLVQPFEHFHVPGEQGSVPYTPGTYREDVVQPTDGPSSSYQNEEILYDMGSMDRPRFEMARSINLFEYHDLNSNNFETYPMFQNETYPLFQNDFM